MAPYSPAIVITIFVAAAILLTRGHRLRPLAILLGVAIVALEAWNRMVLPRSYREDRASRPISLG